MKTRKWKNCQAVQHGQASGRRAVGGMGDFELRVGGVENRIALPAEEPVGTSSNEVIDCLADRAVIDNLDPPLAVGNKESLDQVHGGLRSARGKAQGSCAMLV